MTDTIIQAVIILEAQGASSAQPQIEWAAGYLAKVLEDRSVRTRIVDSPAAASKHAASAKLWITAVGSDGADAALQESVGVFLPQEPESFAFLQRDQEGVSLLAAVGFDTRGLVYALLELVDIAAHAEDPLAALLAVRSRAEHPANPVRSITRLFTSEPEDKPWFYDRGFWDTYLTELATHRFNRFTLSVGAGYDYLIDRVVLDTYFCFFYPFVLAVPGYDVQVEGLSADERERNLEMLRYIAAAAKLRGLEFRMGLWNHAYDYGPHNTNKAYRITGLDETNHAAYCRDALALLLRTCPEIEGLTFRVHFEGGVPEPTHDFWQVAMERIGEAEQLLDIDFHAKGVGEELIDIVNRTGKQVALSAKYWAEHMGPSYHQSSIRGREFARKRPDKDGGKVASPLPSTGNHDARVGGMETTSKRSYTRYGYADFLRDDRPYGVIHRVWPGTQRMLLWGDPVMAAGIGRNAGFQGSLGVEWFEPLSFKGKKGSGSAGERELYADRSLQLGIDDWTKFRYTYRLWGRLAYNPEADPDEWRRYMQHAFGEAAEAAERALAGATRILPLITLVHAPSVANNVYWPEMYTNIPLVRGAEPATNPYTKSGWPANADFDMEAPYNFMNTSPLDPEQIYRINEFAGDVIAGQLRGKLAPPEIADRLERLAEQSLLDLRQAEQTVRNAQDPDFRRLAVDVRIMAGTGRFFAHKFRAGTAFALYEQVGGLALLEEALAHYKTAREAWQDIVAASAGVYRADLTFGHTPYSRGHWADRLAAISDDIAAIENLILKAKSDGLPAEAQGMSDWLAPLTGRERPAGRHVPADGFRKGQAVEVNLRLDGKAAEGTVARLRYRHVNQAEPYQETEMTPTADGSGFTAVIPAVYTDSPYALQYFFDIRTEAGDAWMFPGLDESLSVQPYYVLNAFPS